MKEKFLTLITVFLMGTWLGPIACTQSPTPSPMGVGDGPSANALTPPGDRPVITSDSGPQGVWICKEYVVDHPEKYTIGEIPFECHDFILPNARDARNTNQREIPQRVIPTIDGPVEEDPQLLMIQPSALEELRRGAQIQVLDRTSDILAPDQRIDAQSLRKAMDDDVLDPDFLR